jgi:hypothetical protein
MILNEYCLFLTEGTILFGHSRPESFRDSEAISLIAFASKYEKLKPLKDRPLLCMCNMSERFMNYAV